VQQTHLSAVQFHQSSAGTSSAIPDPTYPNPDACHAIQGPLYELLENLINPDLPPEPSDDTAMSSSEPQLDWDALDSDFEGWLAPSHIQATVSEMVTVLIDWLSNGEVDKDVNSEDELEERSDMSSPEASVGGGGLLGLYSTIQIHTAD